MKKYEIRVILLILCLYFQIKQGICTSRQDYSCTSDQPGAYWTGQKCESCKSSECYCSSYNGCDSCESYYGYSSYSENCYSCTLNITSFDDDRLQIDQDSSYVLESSCCILEGASYLSYSPIVTGCTIKNTTTQFSETGQPIQTGGVCSIVSNCMDEETYGGCSACQSGYYLDYQRKCRSCMTNCLVCEESDQCSQCRTGYYLLTMDDSNSIIADSKDAASVCKQCKVSTTQACICSGTKVYNSDTGSYEVSLCDGCQGTKYYYDSDSQDCIQCSTECATCNSASTCLTCISGYVYNSARKTCLACVDNCYKCEFNSASQASQCLEDQCANGYYYEKDSSGIGVCRKCPSNQNIARCDSTSGSVITQCSPETASNIWSQTYLIQFSNLTYYCLVNSKSCKTISDYDETLQDYNCTSCYEDQSYILIDGYCVAKKSYCASYYTNGQCAECTNSSYKLSQGYCYESILNCLSIDDDDNNKCLSCASGYYINAGYTCTLCSSQKSNCLSCSLSSGTVVCSKCAEGYYLYSNKICASCMSYCKVCSTYNSQLKCSECQSGYYLSAISQSDVPFSNMCREMKAGCIKIDSLTEDCLLCLPVYRLVDGWCMPGYVPSMAFIMVQSTCSDSNIKYYASDGQNYFIESYSIRILYSIQAFIFSLTIIIIFFIFV